MLETMPPANGGGTVRRRSPRRKHFLIGSGVALAGLAATLTVGFLATAGTVSVTASAKSSGTLVQTSSLSFLSTMTWESGNAKAAPKAATWTIAVGADGGVKTGGDVAMVNANTAHTTSSHVVVSVYLANAGAYAKDVPTFDLPVELACSTATVATTKFSTWGTWTYWNSDAVTGSTGETFLTNTSPYLTWDVATATAKYCEVSLGGVGSTLGTKLSGALYLQSSGTANTATYAPTFYVTAQRATS
ncbi:MAG: hypothetical protein ACRDWE_01380 [Acidimicrobiales bacterium]